MSDTAYTTFEAPGIGAFPAEEKGPPKIKEKAEFEALPAGAKYLDPEGATRVKPYAPKSPDEFASVPEGAQYLDPEGQLREKPTYKGVGFTAQMLHDMALTPEGRKQALEKEYPGKVRQGPDGLYIDDEGTLRRPGHGGLTEQLGTAAASTAPAIGMAAGGLAGGVGGTALEPGGGTLLGATGGGVLGGMAGRQFNNIVLGLAGIHEGLGEQVASMGMEGAAIAGGEVAGKAIGAGVKAARQLAPSIGQGVEKAKGALPGTVAKFLGVEPQSMRQAVELSEKGGMVPASAWAHESPHLQNIEEVFYPAFFTDKPMRRSAVNYYEKQAGKLLDDLGIERTEPIVEPKAAVSVQPAGEIILRRTLTDQAAADQALRQALDRRAAQLQTGVPEHTAQREALTRAAEESRLAAQKLIDRGFKDIEQDSENAFKVAQAGGNSGDLWEHIGAKLQSLRRGISERARYWYDRYDQMTGGYRVSSHELASSAQQMLDELPAEFKARNPALVQKLAKLGAQHGEEGEMLKPAEQLTYGQIHGLRNVFRGSADWTTLSSDFKNGALKRFSNEIDRIIHDPSAPVEVRNAAKFLNMVDKWYGNNVRIFNAQQIKTVMKGLEAGEPADPVKLYQAVVKEGHTDLIARIKQMVGPNLWSGVRAADTRAMLDASKSLEPGVIDARKFAREVLERHRANMLDVVHGREASEKLLAQARAIERLDGRLQVPAKPDDTMTQVIARARLAADEAKAFAARAPLGSLEKEMKALEAEKERIPAQLRAAHKDDPLNFLYDSSTGAKEAVEKILHSEDLVLAAAARFGEESAEFNALRQVYVQRVFENTLDPSARLVKISPEIQRLMFPGASLQQAQMLAKEMAFLMKRRGMAGTTQGGMSAMAKIEHPVTGKAGEFPVVKQVEGVIGPLVNPVARFIHGKIYQGVTKLMTSPATLRWIEKGLNSTSKAEREAVRAALERYMMAPQQTAAGLTGAQAGALGYERNK